MDISDINKIVNRKRINSEVENFRRRVTSETAKIIKVKVSQDTAYWELKEKFQHFEINHEKLQQNMIELQTQLETASGQYQDERRCRHETLYKLKNTRKVCHLLENYCENMKDTLAKCKADQETLGEAFQKAGEVVRDIKTKFEQKEEKYKLTIQNLEEKVKSTSDQQIQLVQYLKAAKQQVDRELCTTKAELATALALNDMGRKQDQDKREKSDNALSSLQVDMKRQVQEHNIQIGDFKNEVAKLQKEQKELTEAKASLEEALMNRDAFTKTICDEKRLSLEKLAVAAEKRSIAEKERSIALGKVNVLEVELESTSIKCNQLIENVKEKNKLEIAVKDMEQMLVQYKQEIDTLKLQLSTQQAEKSDLTSALNTALNVTKSKTAKIDEITEIKRTFEKKLAEREIELKLLQETNESKIKELTNLISNYEKDLTLKVAANKELMTQVKNETAIRSILENDLQKLQKEWDKERETAKQFALSNRDKEIEIPKQTKRMLEKTTEKPVGMSTSAVPRTAKHNEHVEYMFSSDSSPSSDRDSIDEPASLTQLREASKPKERRF